MAPTAALELLEIRVLGGFRFICGGSARRLRPSSERLVAFLAIVGGQRRCGAAVALWPDMTDNRSLANLRTVLWRLRSDHPDLVEEDADGVGLSDDVVVDLHRVRSWAFSAIKGDTNIFDPPPDVVALDLLPTWGDSWLVEPRHELRVLQLHALESATQRLMMGGRLGEAATCALKAVIMDPFRESANRLLIEVYLREGNQVDALRQYRKFQTLLAREIGVEPGPALTALISSYFDIRPTRTKAGTLNTMDRRAGR